MRSFRISRQGVMLLALALGLAWLAASARPGYEALWFMADLAGADEPASTLTKREWMATMCLQGILANKSIHKYTVWSATQSAIMYANQLLDNLEKDVRDEGGYPQPETFPLTGTTQS